MTKIKSIKKPTNDKVFYLLFGKAGNEKITKDLIESITGEDIGKITLDRTPMLLNTQVETKKGIVDVIAENSIGEKYIIEMQCYDKGNIEDRITYYWSKKFSEQLKEGEQYDELKKVVIIAIVDYEIENLEDVEDCHTNWEIREAKYVHKKLTDKLEMHIIEIPKYLKNKEKEENQKLISWLEFLKNPESEEVKESMRTMTEIREAVKKYNEIIADKEVARILWLEEKWERDRISEESWKKKQAEKRERIMKEREQIAEKRGKKEVIKKMQEKGYGVEEISEILDLTVEEVKELL